MCQINYVLCTPSTHKQCFLRTSQKRYYPWKLWVWGSKCTYNWAFRSGFPHDHGACVSLGDANVSACVTY